MKRNISERILLSILVVPALGFISLVLVITFTSWSEVVGANPLAGAVFVGFFLLCGAALSGILFGRRMLATFGFIGFVLLLTFLMWPLKHGPHRQAVVRDLLSFFLLGGLLLASNFFLKREPKGAEEPLEHQAQGDHLLVRFFRRLPTATVVFAVAFSLAFIILAAWWAYHH